MRSPVVELLADLAVALEGARVPWFLFGAQAAILHGAARLTADVDVTVRLPDAMSTEALAQALERHQFRRRIADPAFIARTRVLPFVHRPTTLPLDVVLAGPGLEDTFFERAQVRDVDGVLVSLASPEDIVIMKVLAGRPKDLDDVVAIVTAYGDALDVGHVEATLATLEAALAQSDLLPAWRQTVARARRARL
jgi:hypothetical protein